MNSSHRVPRFVFALLLLCACRPGSFDENEGADTDAQARTVEGARGRPEGASLGDASLAREAGAGIPPLADAEPAFTSVDAGSATPNDAATSQDAYVEPVCVAGETRCLSGNVQQTCSAAGAWGEELGCAVSCAERRCGECVPSSRECVGGLVPRLCTADGKWTSEAPCAGRTPLCMGAGECRCRPGTSRCDGSQPQVCSANHEWVAVGPPCVHCTQNGRCSGEECSDARRADCSAVGCECASNECAGAFCTTFGDGCTDTRRAACSAVGCGCVDGACAHGMCAPPGA